MYCDQYGTAIQDSNILCPQCGTKQEHAEISVKTATTEKESTTKLDISWIFKILRYFYIDIICRLFCYSLYAVCFSGRY